MTLNDIRALLQTEAPFLHGKGIARLYVFGSMARGEPDAASDVDLMYEAAAGRVIGFFDRLEIAERLSARLGEPIDLVNRANLDHRIRDAVLAEGVRVL
jgi:predicted nucleotidyltransferase